MLRLHHPDRVLHPLEGKLPLAFDEPADCRAHVAGLSGEHVATGETIDRLAAMAAGGGEWAAAVIPFLDELRDHIGREEYDLFPTSIPALAADGWELAADARH